MAQNCTNRCHIPLRQHPGVEIISRDRSTQYLRGAIEGAPQAQQVIDRWHVLKNLREAVERFLNRTQMQRNKLVGPSQEISLRQKRTKGERALSEGARLRRLALYDQVVELYKQGGSILGIARQLQVGHQTVRKCVKTPSFPERSKAPRTKSEARQVRKSQLSRWHQKCKSRSGLVSYVTAQPFLGAPVATNIFTTRLP